VSLLSVPTSAVAAASDGKASSSSNRRSSGGKSSWMMFGRKAHSCRERVPEDTTIGKTSYF